MAPNRFRAMVAALPLAMSAVAAMTYPDCVRGPLANNTVCNPEAAPAERAAALVQAMTMDEKLVNLVNTSPGAPRLGLPAYEWWSEALHGVAGSPGVRFNRSASSDGEPAEFAYATSFASPITLSAAFDDDLVERVATVISTEARAFSNGGHAGLDFWTPNINPYKDPRWGRGAETPGEDPVRIKGYVKALIRGLEGPYRASHTGASNGTSSVRRVVATCKHFAAYDLERWNGTTRYGFDAVVSLQDLSEYYLPPFQQCARDSRVGSVMCSYNSVNGTPACANTYLMTDILREHWGWTDENQYITSDCNAIMNFNHEHKFSPDAAHAAASAYSAGTDSVCEVPGYEATAVRTAFNQSLLSPATVDRALARQYEGLVRAGYFDPPNSSAYRALSWKDVDTPLARRLARQSAADGLVLKKNDGGRLPLDLRSGNKSVALVGFWADQGHQMLGGYSGTPPFVRSPLDAAKRRNLTCYYGGDGAPVSPPAASTDTWTAPALAAARKADVVVYFGGNDLSIEAEDRDRTSVAWPPAQLDLIAALAALGKPTVVVQLGDQNDDTPLLRNANVSAILSAGFPGQDGGTAVWDVLTGRLAPAGRLPVTQYPAAYVDAVPMTDMALRPGPGNPGRTYRWFEHAVLPFGHGLHYTPFSATISATIPANQTTALGRRARSYEYSIADLVAGCKTVAYKDLCPWADVSVAVANRGNTTRATSDFVALLFVGGEHGPAPHPIKTLVAYRRLRRIGPGRTRTARLPLTLGSLARTDASGNLVLYPGNYTLLLDEPTQSQQTFALTGEAVVLDHFPQPGNNTNRRVTG